MCVTSGPEYLMADTKLSFDVDSEFTFFLMSYPIMAASSAFL